MARQETILSVFVASPSDVDEERNRLEEVIRELNTAWAGEIGIRLELIRWETHAYPSFGEDAQAVINDQIPDDYDLFIGLMWYRFGTQTGRAGSGTAEEFQRAKKRFDQDPSSLQLMIYFKDAPVPVAPSKLDHAQLTKVAEFRSDLEDKGGLYWSFVSLEDFEKLVRLHLTRHIQTWRSKHSVVTQDKSDIKPSIENEDASDSGSFDLEDEPGILDLMEQFEDEFTTITEITERIATATNEIGEKMSARTVEIKQFASGPDSTNRKEAKRLISRAAADMDQYVQRMDAEIPIFGQHLNIGMNAIVKTAAMTIEFKVESDDLMQAKENLVAVRGFSDSLTNVEHQITEFQDKIASLPRMTTSLNRSKRSMVNVLQRLINEFRNGHAMAKEAEASFASIIDQ
ncbi:DUF4062 domain-containing protein [Desulfobacula phenolica]|uniref:DUF4062 domain-containing protein n=1 Tax=Desulfobacula phenolica TaxID=90732 RepID=A0A1H2KFZ9_9BACT|nr:DUF4062 domain-containing protein [Desulfobacula phenolica]SDU67564.1 protein of unknown function [Desulfobacula phenolica]